MKLKTHKIRNVEKTVCTCEQMIAYNYVSMYSSIAKNIAKADTTEGNKLEAFHDLTRKVIEDCKNHGYDKKYNIDAIQVAFYRGIQEYGKQFFIANDYETVGKMFNLEGYEII